MMKLRPLNTSLRSKIFPAKKEIGRGEDFLILIQNFKEFAGVYLAFLRDNENVSVTRVHEWGESHRKQRWSQRSNGEEGIQITKGLFWSY